MGGHAEELEAVLDQVGSEHAAIMAHIDAGPTALVAQVPARAMASPRTIQAFTGVMLELDSRPILPRVQAPTLVLAKQGFQIIPIEQARYLASRFP
jgi:pimeloyl-ACP methyl ester carboxylesterase